MKTILILLVAWYSFCVSTMPLAAEVYRWVDKNGNVFFSDTPPLNGAFKKQTIEDEIDKTIQEKKEIDKRSDINEAEKLDQKIKLEIEYQKKAKAIKDYQMMKEELNALREKYEEKFNELKRQWNRSWPGTITRYEIKQDAEKLKKQYEQEVKQIKNYYGYE